MAERLDHRPEREVVGPEVVAPFRDAVRLVDDEQRRPRLAHALEDLLVGELLGREQHELDRALLGLLEGLLALALGQRRVDQLGLALGARGKVIYVGKAKSIKKRVASHFSNSVVRGDVEMRDIIDDIQFVTVNTEAEALLAEQNFIKQYQPKFNVRLRDDKSYPFIAISTDEEFPRVYFTRERHRRDRVYFGPYSNAKKTRGTIDILSKIFQFRSCQGPEPGRRSGSPCLDYYIKRCGAPCVGYVDREQYMEAINGVVAFLSGRYREIERDIETRMRAAAEDQE